MRESSVRAIYALISAAVVVVAGLPVTASARARPDLVVASVSSAPTAGQGGRMAVKAKVTNRGKAKAGASALGFFLSTDSKRGDDVKLKPTRKIKTLAERASSAVTTDVTIPSSTPLGEYQVIACADVGKVIGESDEKNNCRASAATVAITGPPSATDLIEQDEAAGTLSHEKALTFEVFAAFGDPRLPDRYASAPRESVDHAPLMEIKTEWESLSDQTQSVLQPFLIPPYHAGSYWSEQPLERRARSAEADVPWWCGTEPVPTDQAWRFLDVPGAPVRIWWQLRYDATDNETATALASHIPKAWNAVTSYMGRDVESDGGGFCDGGSDAFDIALVDAGTATVVSDGFVCQTPDSSHLLWPRNMPADWKHPAPYLAHEFMHAAQFSIDTSAGCGEYAWLREATAQWFMDYVTDPTYGISLPGDDAEQAAAQLLMKYSSVPLDALGPPVGHAYGAYLLFLHAARSQPGGANVVKNVWDATVSSDSLSAVDGALAGGFKDAWKKFALANWNDGPIHDYKDWDGLTETVNPVGPYNVAAAESSTTLGLHNLSAKYLELTWDQTVNEIEFRNDRANHETAAVQAVIYYDDGTHEVKDLSKDAKSYICVNDGTKKATRVILVFSNGSRSDGIQFAPTFVGNEACGCPNLQTGTTPRMAREAADSTGCAFRGNVTFSYSESSTEPRFQWEDSGSGDVSLFLFEDPNDPGYFESKNSSYSVSSSGSSYYDRDGQCADEFADWTSEGSGPLEDGAVFAYLNGDVLEVYPFFLPVTQRGSGGFECGETQQHEPFETAVGPGSCPLESEDLFYPFVRQGGEDSKIFAFSCTSTGPSSALGLPTTRSVTINASVNLSLDP